MTSPEATPASPARRALAGFEEPLRRHLEALARVCRWDPDAATGEEALPDFRGKRLAFCRWTVRHGGSTRVMIEQMAALEGTGAAVDVFCFHPLLDPRVVEEIRARCPSVGEIRPVDRRLASRRSLLWRAWPGRYDLIVSTDIVDPLIFAQSVRKFRLMRPPRIAVMLHEEYDRYVTFLAPHAARIAGFCLDYDFSERMRAVYGPAMPMDVVAPLFPLESPRADGGPLRRELGIPENARVMGYCGRLDANKQIERLIDVLERLLAEGCDGVWLLLAGRWDSPALRARLAQQVAREVTLPSGRTMKVGERVREAGERPSLGPVYGAMDLFVFASRIEGFYPLVVMEAQQAGLPVVGAAVGGLKHAILDGVTGFLAPTDARDTGGATWTAETVEVFTARVRLLLDDRALRERLGDAGRSAVSFLTAHYPFGPLFRRWVGQRLATGEGAR